MKKSIQFMSKNRKSLSAKVRALKQSFWTGTIYIASALPLMSLGLSQANAQETKSMLQCQIEAPSQAKVGEPIELKFTLTNAGKEKLAVLKWNTPLEGWFGSSFNVTRDGQWVTYQGAMVKRFRPSEEDYAQIAPGDSLVGSVNMAEGYDMKAPGKYKLVFNGRLQDVQTLSKGKEISEQRHLQSLKCNELTVTVD